MNILQLLGIQPAGAAAPDPAAMASPAPATDPLSAFGDATGSYAPQGNFLQALNGGTNAAPPPVPAPVQPAATQPARSRSSLLDRIGRVADVIATVGGAHPLYQPTLDARQDRTLSLGDHDRSVTLQNQQITTGQGAIGDANAARVQRAAQAIQAIRAQNPQADVASIFPLVAKQAGLDDEHAAALGQQISDHPELIDGLAGRPKMGKVISAQDKDGNYQLFQLGDDEQLHPLDLGQFGAHALPDKLTVTNNGGTTSVLGPDGKPINTLENTAKPDTLVNASSRERVATGRNATAVQVANIRGNATTTAANIRAGATGKGKPGSDPFTSYSNGIHAISSLDQSLGDLVNDPALTGATGLVGGHLRLTAGQRAIQGKIDSLTGQAIPAAIAAIKASGGASPRAVSEIMGEVKGLVGAIQNRDMATPDYVANVNAARARLRQRVQDMTDDAVRQGFAVRNSNGRIAPAGSSAPAAPSKPILPRNFTGRPGATQSLWGR